MTGWLPEYFVLFVWLVFNGTSTQEGQILPTARGCGRSNCANCERVKPTRAVENLVWCLTACHHRKVNVVPTVGGRNRLTWLRMSNERQCIILHMLHNYNVTHFTVKRSSNKTATTDYLIQWLTCLNILLTHSPVTSQITHSLFGIISLGVDAVLCHAWIQTNENKTKRINVADSHQTGITFSMKERWITS